MEAFIRQKLRGDGKNALRGALGKLKCCSTLKAAGLTSRAWDRPLPGETLWAGRLLFQLSLFALFHRGDLTGDCLRKSYSDPILR